MSELSEEQKRLYKSTAQTLSGSDRRVFMAGVVNTLGKGGQRRAARELGWGRRTIQLGMHELDSGLRCYDNFGARGRHPIEERLPNLLTDLSAIVDGQSQTDPSFASTRLYTRLSANAVRAALMSQKGYTAGEVPSEETIRVRLNRLGYTLRSVQKSLPKKR